MQHFRQNRDVFTCRLLTAIVVLRIKRICGVLLAVVSSHSASEALLC
jgi:hypothetical protein